MSSPPRCRIGRDVFIVVNERDVLDDLDEFEASSLLRRALEDDLGAAREIVELAEELTGSWRLSLAEATRIVVQEIVRGGVVPVRVGPKPERLGASNLEPIDLRELRDPVPPVEPPPPVATPTWIEIRVLGETGLSVAGTEIRLRLPDGGERSLRLDQQATVYVDEIQKGGSCHVQIVGPIELTAAEPSANLGSSASQVSIPAGEGGHTDLATGATHLISVRRPVARIVELDDACFDTAGVVLRPEAAVLADTAAESVSGLLGIGAALRVAEHEELRWLVVGHADTVGQDEDNLLLSQARAMNVQLLLGGDARAGRSTATRTTPSPTSRPPTAGSRGGTGGTVTRARWTATSGARREQPATDSASATTPSAAAHWLAG